MIKQVFGGTDQGLVRDTNQDRFAVGTIDDTMCFAIVCDGMGGKNGGNVASEIAVEFAEKALLRDLSTEMTELSIRAVFSTIFSATNALIYEASKKDANLEGMGTTMVIAVAQKEQLFISTVGDSRAYVANPNHEKQLTKDHTVVQMMVDMGEITPEDAQHHPKRHFITRAVGVAETIDMDFMVHGLKDDDIVLLCSDGLYNYLEAGNLYPLLKTCVEGTSVQALIDLAKEGGGSDNITATIMA